ncbi:MAG: hypothetical protein GY874_18405 [Desulfobacteraceae bacterium]|nr:hypothetical protein [Desulfobacteraceae bacterium]
MNRSIISLQNDYYDGDRRTFIVLGAPRGGTSMIAGLLRLFGIYMGNKLGHQHEDPQFRKETTLDTKIDQIEKNNKSHKKWGWKLPNTIYYYEDIKNHIINPVFVVIYRNPLSIAMSSADRDNRDFRFKLAEVPINHYRKMHNLISNNPDVPSVMISYDEAIRQNKKKNFLINFAKFLNLSFTEKVMKDAIEFINPEKGYKVIK